MRRLSALSVAIGMVLLACAAPPTALPQQLQTVPWTYVSVQGDTVAGRIGFSLNIDTVAARQVIKTLPATVDTLWCTTAGVCSKAKPPVAADTVRPVPVLRGIPFGPFGLMAAGANPGAFSLSVGAVNAKTVVAQIAEARRNGIRLLMAMTGGAHANYLSVINGVLQFDYTKWKARMDSYDTPEIREAVATGLADGTIIGEYVMDEPHVSGSSTNPKANTWGSPGTMTKARVDSLCGYVKKMFPGLPVGVAHHAAAFEPTKLYSTCDFILAQYASRQGSLDAFLAEQLAYTKRNGIGLITSLNVLNGGTQDRDGTWDCKGEGQAGKGQWDPNCRMTPRQIREFSRVLGPAGCGLLLWQFDQAYMDDPRNQQAFQDVATELAAAPARPCRRAT